MPNESAMFIISMSNTMGTLWPSPIEMDPMDDGTILTNDQKNTNIIASRWAVCTEIIRLMLSRMVGCGVDVAIGKNTEFGVSMTHGNSDDEKLQETISKMVVSNEEPNVEFVLREIEKMAKNENTKKRVHWFIDAETYINLNPELIERKFPSKLVTIYPIGDLSIFHDNFQSAKHVTTRLVHNGVDVRFLVCRSDLNELKGEILAEKRYEMVENVAMCKFGKEKFEVKLNQSHALGKPNWSVKTLYFYGFLPEIDLCRLGFSSQQGTPESHVPITADSENGQRILYSMGEYILSEHKKPRVALFRYHGEQKKTRGFCIMVAHGEIPEKAEIWLSMIRLNKAISRELKVSLDYVDEIDEPSEPLPDPSAKPYAPESLSRIRKRIAEIGELNTPEAKRKKFGEFADEYKILDARDTFMKTTALWQKQFLREPTTTSDGNNNKKK